MKKSWQTPGVEVLDIKMTMAGPGLRIVDETHVDPDEVAQLRYS